MNRLLTPEELENITNPCLADKECPFGCENSTDDDMTVCHNCDILTAIKAQDKKSISLRDKQWIEKIEKFGMTAVPSDYMYIISETEWQSLKREMESE